MPPPSRRRLVLLAALLILASGCRHDPPLSGGKPVEHWLHAVHDADAKIRRHAVKHLGSTGATEPAVWDALTGALYDRSAEVRRDAILALMQCGPRAHEAVPILAELRQRDPDARVRNHAARALARLEREAP